MDVYVIIGNDWKTRNVLGVCLTEQDAERFMQWYKDGVKVAGFEDYGDSEDDYDIERYHVSVFEYTVSHTRQEEDR